MNFTRQRYYCAEPETQDLVMGLRDIPFQVAIKEVSQDPLFEKYAMEVLKNFPMCSYQSYFDSTCYDEFLKVLQRLSAEDWIKIEKFNSDLLKKQQSCDIFSRMNSFESDTFVNTPKNNSPKSYSEITKSPDESQKLNNSASPVERDAFSTDCANELKSDNDINFQNFQTDIRTLILPKQSPGAFYSDYFRMAVSYFLDLFKSKLERDVRHLKTEFDSPIPAPFPDYSLRNEAFPLTFSDPMLAHLPSPCYNNIFSSHQQSYFFPTDPLYYYPNPPMGGYYF